MTSSWHVPFAEWIASGERIAVELPQSKRKLEVFVRVEGEGPWLTMLHGFPTCSMDWARVIPLVKHGFRTLCFDFPGFGDSDKPSDHDYGIPSQASCIEAVWRHFGVTRSFVIAHDLGGTILIELLRRHAEGSLAVEIPAVLLMNCALYPEAYRPILAQRLLLNKWMGPLFSRFVIWSVFKREYGSIFAPGAAPSDAQLAEFWKSILHRQGKHNYHLLIQYIAERIRERARWEPVAETTRVPIRYLWGMLDEIEGSRMMALMRQRLPRLDARELAEVGHSPQLEVPQLVADELLALRGGG